MRAAEGKENKGARERAQSDPNVYAIIAADQAATLQPSPEVLARRVKEAKLRLEQDLEARVMPPAEPRDAPGEERPETVLATLGRYRFAIDPDFIAPGGVFMEPTVGNAGQIVVRLNRSHPWFKFYESAGLEGRSALNLLLIALAKAEIERQDDAVVDDLDGPSVEPPRPRTSYYDVLTWLRESSVSPFLRDGSRVLGQTLPHGADGEDSD
jgi:hypothetical protein